MHGIGNDYVYLDAFSDASIGERVEGAGWADLVRRMSDRHTGVGGDGVIVVGRPSPEGRRGGAHVRMRIFNADASEAEMCGNGVRCVARLAREKLGIAGDDLRVETGRGVLTIRTRSVGGRFAATVDMGKPIFEAARIPTTLPAGRDGRVVEAALPGWSDMAGAGGLEPGSFDGRFTCVSMGNPHAVVFGTRLDAAPLERLGPLIERHAAFPSRVNVHFAEVDGPGKTRVRTWERGSGVTRACGTGACAVLVAGVLTGRLDRRGTVALPGGELTIEWGEDASGVSMTGPAEWVFEGEWTEGGA